MKKVSQAKKKKYIEEKRRRTLRIMKELEDEERSFFETDSGNYSLPVDLSKNQEEDIYSDLSFQPIPSETNSIDIINFSASDDDSPPSELVVDSPTGNTLQEQAHATPSTTVLQLEIPSPQNPSSFPNHIPLTSTPLIIQEEDENENEIGSPILPLPFVKKLGVGPNIDTQKMTLADACELILAGTDHAMTPEVIADHLVEAKVLQHGIVLKSQTPN